MLGISYDNHPRYNGIKRGTKIPKASTSSN
jgi:hypothetical protein